MDDHWRSGKSDHQVICCMLYVVCWSVRCVHSQVTVTVTGILESNVLRSRRQDQYVGCVWPITDVFDEDILRDSTTLTWDVIPVGYMHHTCTCLLPVSSETDERTTVERALMGGFLPRLLILKNMIHDP